MLKMKVAQWADEPAWSLLQRLAAQHGTGTARQFCHDHGLRPLAKIMSAQDVDDLSELGGYDADVLRASTAVGDGALGVSIGDQSMSAMDLFRKAIRICPACLREDMSDPRGAPAFRAHYRQWWAFTDFLCCPVHGTLLLEDETFDRTCPDPRFAAGPERDLSKETSLPADGVAFETYVLGRLGFAERISSEILDALPMNLAMRLAMRIGWHATWGPQAKMDERAPNALRASANHRGIEILSGSKDGLVDLFDRWVDEAEPPKGNWGPIVVYGRLYDWLSQERRWTGNAYDQVREIMFAHALSNIPLTTETPFFGKTIERREIYSLHHVWQETGFHTTRLRPILIKAGLIDQQQASRPDWKVFLDRDRMEEFRALASQLMNFEETMAYLGIPRSVHTQLDFGALGPEPFVQTGEQGRGEILYRKSDLEAWMTAIHRNAPFLEARSEDQVGVLTAKRILFVSTENLLRKLMSGEMQCAGRLRDEKPLAAVTLDIASSREAMSGRAEDQVDYTTAQSLLGTTHYVLTELIEAGWITRHETNATRRSKPLVSYSRTQVDEFRAGYISVREAAKWLGTHSRVLRARLETVNIRPVIETTAGPASAFFRREDIEALPEGSFRSRPKR